MDILDYWYFGSPPREVQVKALEWLAKQDAKYLILEAPVGSGKSLIGATFSRFCAQSTERGDAFFLTPQRILQKQYEDTFSRNDMHSFYGKSNYRCAQKNTTCAVGSIGRGCKNCAYEHAKLAALRAPNCVLNYKLALLAFSYVPKFRARIRPLMVLDECHQLERHLIDFNTVPITAQRCKKLNINFKQNKTLSAAVSWIEQEYYDIAGAYLNELSDRAEPLMDQSAIDLSKGDIRLLQEYNSWMEHMEAIDGILMLSNTQLNDEYVLVHDALQIQFKRLYGKQAFRQIIAPNAKQFLFMSSTVLNKDAFCKDLGIDPNEAAFLSMDSEFPPENRHVLYRPQMRMNASWPSDNNISGRRKMIRQIGKILDMHDEDSGIIHTSSFAIAKWLVEELDDVEHKVFHHNPGCDMDRNEVIAAFQECDSPSVLISPSITEGLDLTDDLGRFAIFSKVPFGYLGDQWIKRRMEISGEWYQRMALTEIIQGGGRIVRGKDDWGVTYILDESWARLFHSTHHMIPQWYREAYNKVH